MDRRDFFKLIGSVSALSLLSGCMGSRRSTTSLPACTWPEDDGIQIRSGGPWDSRLNPTQTGQPPVNGFSFGSPPINCSPKPSPKSVRSLRTQTQNSQNLSAVGRNAWKAKGVISSRMRPMGGVSKITIHHEGNPKPNYDKSPSQVANSLRQIQRVHFKRLKAGDIAYHFVVDRQGLIWQGRSIKYQGAHTRGNNPHNIGVMCLGNFEIQRPTTQQLATLAQLCSTLCDGYSIRPNHIYGHRELRSTACPGKYLFPKVCQIRNLLLRA